ncbi:type II toxin-antitoxin system RelE/ParE family toxin [Indioceanicola profundi]|uniref:type II toxin-antitoxin system RelE/ParE family toxin n=1 Tax=Indioceanicola profundi TaxID=2220096 RepID=UPI0013C4E5D5|nr:type II toxin-antitoxin system RelE/ParE family toxin [Indioceanicola profundi]
MRLVFSQQFVDRLHEIHAYVSQHNPRAARAQVQLLRQAAKRLRSFPHLGHPAAVVGTRDLKVPGTPFLLRYRVGTDVIEMLAIFHERQRRD